MDTQENDEEKKIEKSWRNKRLCPRELENKGEIAARSYYKIEMEPRWVVNDTMDVFNSTFPQLKIILQFLFIRRITPTTGTAIRARALDTRRSFLYDGQNVT